MTTKRVIFHTRDNAKAEIVASVDIASDADRLLSLSAYYTVRLLVGTGTARETVALWSQTTNDLNAGVPYRMSGVSDVNYPVPEDGSCWIEVEQFGSPADTSGLACVVRMAVVGGVQESPEARGGLVHRSDISKALVDVGSSASAGEEILEDAANTVLRPSWTVAVPLHGLFT